MSVRFGIGYDSHRLEPGNSLVVGGVTIEYELGLAGHSDADVLTHAVIDALLGAAALGDIGQHFPDTDPAYARSDSIGLLEATVGMLREAGFEPFNIDSTVVCEAPKLAPHRDAMRGRIATATGLADSSVNVKFTTGEGVGFVGRQEGVAAYAVASVGPAES